MDNVILNFDVEDLHKSESIDTVRKAVIDITRQLYADSPFQAHEAVAIFEKSDRAVREAAKGWYRLYKDNPELEVTKH